MTVILVDARHFGAMVRYARKKLKIKQPVAAKLMGISLSEYKKYEDGKAVIRDATLLRIMHHAFVGMNTRYIMQNLQKNEDIK